MTPEQLRADSMGSYELAIAEIRKQLVRNRQKLARLIAARGRAGGAG